MSSTCPLCGGAAKGPAFPYATFFSSSCFTYLQCAGCKSVFLDPMPKDEVFSRMYAKSAYHDVYYAGEDLGYEESARLLRRHLEPGSTVLDYGCGMGGFMKSCAAHELMPFGVEFDSAAAMAASQHASCDVMSVEAFDEFKPVELFDALHLGDVLEHLPTPTNTLNYLLQFLKPGGLLFVEGPLEVNPSPVYWSARLFGATKRVLMPTFMSHHPPTHLFRTDALAQRNFFHAVRSNLRTVYWKVYETGWPYRHGGLIKRLIAAFAILLGSKKLGAITFGNRFQAIFIAP